MNYNITPERELNGLTVAELFCGGGLMAAGLKSAGYNIIWANDFEKAAARAYAANIGDHVVCGDITSAAIQNLMPEADIVAGGPPCQDYSVAGNGEGEDGERGALVYTYLSLIWQRQPKAFIFENVKGLIQKKHRHTFDALVQQMEFIGYKVSWKLINAWDHGVAQKRERVFIVGIREDLGFEFQFPEPPEHERRTRTIRDAIGDLPHVMGMFKNHEPEDKLPMYIQNVVDGKTSTNFGQGIPVNDGTTPAKTLTATYRSKCPMEVYMPPERVANHDKKSYWYPKGEYTYGQANRVQDMDGACATIPAHHNSGQPIHPTEFPRRFTVRECLRLQSVPDWYVLPEGMALGPQYKIVGNGVASKVAYDLGIALAEQLKERLK